MNIFFLLIDLILSITFILFLPLSKFCIKIGVNFIIGFRTKKSISSIESWEKANLLFGKYFFILGIFSFIFTLVLRFILPFRMEITTLILTILNMILMFILIGIINKKI